MIKCKKCGREFKSKKGLAIHKGKKHKNGRKPDSKKKSREDYDFKSMEEKWQERWEEKGVFEVEKDEDREKFFIIFAYPGISGFLHVGHMRGYSYTDMIAKYKRMKDHNVLFSAGTHATGNQAMAFANKVKRGNEDWIEYLRKNGCPEDKIEELTNPEEVVSYFNKVYVEDYWKKFGFSIDWRRFTSTINPDYNKFIQWQFKKLKEKDLLTQKPYFATYCPNCGPVAVDPSETDISEGGDAEKNEFTLLKFPFEDGYIVAATLRPETIYGQTNMWVRPGAEYVQIRKDDEKWWASKPAAKKLSYQKDSFEITDKTKKGKEFIGKYCKAPGIDRKIMILPSKFAEPEVGTGFVTSVPSDAPYDYVALKELQKDEEKLEKYDLDPDKVEDIEVIPIIKTDKYGDKAGVKVVEEEGIENQDDPQLEELTQKVYKAGFHNGTLLDNCGKYSGMKVSEAKERMKQDLIKQGKADSIYDLSEEVICRCGEEVLIKKIDDQWFIRYSDKDLTERSKERVKNMDIYPEQYYKNLPGILDWFEDRACARLGNWLGTKLPFDERWTIEPISDSTLYPIYYLVSKYYNEDKISLEEMDEEFFDYVFLGKGEAKKEIWEDIRKDVEYWYPLDVNLGGKEHKTVHFPVFVMNHVGILPEEEWPKGIFVNYWITGKGGKISKSKGGAEPIPDAIDKYGVDSIRLYYAHAGNPHTDIVWDREKAKHYRRNLEKILNMVEDSLDKGEEREIDRPDKILLSKMNKSIKSINENFEELNLQKISNSIFFDLYKQLNRYYQENGNNKKVIEEFLEKWVKMMAPFTPHIAEELWKKIGKEEFVVESGWPEAEEDKIDEELEKQEEQVEQLAEDIRNVKDILEDKGKTVENAFVYVIPPEKEIYESSKELVEKKVGMSLEVYAVNEDDKYDPQNKSDDAKPGKPAIYLE